MIGNPLKNINSKRFLASGSLTGKIVGAFMSRNWHIWTLMILLGIWGLSACYYSYYEGHSDPAILFSRIWENSIYQLAWLLYAVSLSVSICTILTDIFILLKKESGITWCQIYILIFMGLGIMGMLLIFDVKDNPRLGAVLGIAGTILTWIFQDTIKGIVAFIHLRLNHSLNIDDWIKIPKYEVDGRVRRVTLTMVTIYNWDTTTSTVPISALHSEHFQNLRMMLDGKTYGRQMKKSFIFDTNWFCMLSKDDIRNIEEKHNIHLNLSDKEIGEGILNARAYRLYLYHWLMAHPHISQKPRLIVRWTENKESGMLLEVQAFIIDCDLTSFEWQQSQIIEHIMESFSWFKMQLFQEVSANDITNNKVYIVRQSFDNRKEDLL